MNTVVTSKEAILKACREIVSEEGLPALNMRAVAQRCGVALGSIYNYFSDKDELVLETIESVWRDIFHMDSRDRDGLSFTETVQWIFDSVRRAAGEYPNFFTAHSLSFASDGRDRAKNTMYRYLEHMKAGMAEALAADPAVRPDCFVEGFSQADFLDFVLSGLIVLLIQQKDDCRVLLEMVRRTIY